MTNEEQIKKWKKQLEEYDKKRVAELNEIRSTPSVPISSRNKDADNLTFTGTLLGGISNFTGAGSFADKIISDFKNDPTLMAKAKEQGLDTSQLYTTQENLNMFGSDVKRVVEAGGAGLSSALSNLGKGTVLFARDMGGATALADKLTNEYRNKSDRELEEIAKKANISTQTLKDYVSKAKTSYENVNDFSANTFDKWANEANQRVQELQAETDNPFTKEAIGFMPNLSQQAVTLGASLINPVLGTSVASGQAKGSYFNDAKQRGMTDEQANDFSSLMAGAEGVTEMIGVDKLIKAGKGAKALAKGGLKSARKELSKEVITSTFGNLLSGATDNFLQEAITEPIQEGVADWIAGKGNWENIDQRMLEAGINGAITSLIIGGANIGIQSAVGVASKTRNGQTATQQEVNQGLVDTLAEIDKLSKEEKQEFVDKYVTPGIETAQDVVKNEQNQVPIEPNRAVPMQTSENAQQQVQEQEQQVISNQNENALKSNVEPQNLVESAKRSGIDVKDEKTRKNLETIQKFNENRGVKATFDADAFKGHDNVNSFFRTDENGNREIVFNPNTMTDKTIEQLAVHEVYHDMVAGETAQELTDFVVQKMSNNPEYQEYVRALQDVYEKQDSDIIKEEAVAHYLEKNLGTNEFISELQERGDRTTIQRIIDTIKDMITKAKNTLTGKGDLNYLLDLQRKYEQAYRGEFKGTQEQTKLSKQVVENRKALENKFKDITGDTIMQAETKLAGIELRNAQRKNGNLTGELETNSYSKEAMDLFNKYHSSKKSSNYLYHSTSSENLQSILKNGLTIGNKQNQEGISSKNKLYLATNEELAQSFAPNENITFRINPNANLENLENDLLGGGGTYSITNNIPPNMLQIKENGKWINLEKSKIAQENTISNQPTTDNQGRTLTKEQQDYFKDSKARDENGKLLPVYHSTSSEFNVYDKNKMGQNYGWLEFGDGFYFTPSLETAKDFGEVGLRTGKTNIKEQYLDIENPFNIYKSNDKETINKMALDIENEYNQKNNSNLKISDFKKENGGRFIDFLKNGLNYSDKEIQNILKKYGYDGINAIENKNGEYKGQVVAFEPNQIKNVDNTNPTKNVDIRYQQQGTGTSQEIINNFLENTKVNEGTGTAIKDLARVPVPKTDYKALLQPQLDKLSASDKAQISEIIDNLDAQGQLNEEAYNSALETINALQEVPQETTPTDELSVNLRDGKYGKFDSELSDYRNRYNKGQLDYNKDVVNSAMELVPGKKIQGQQKRTKAEWLRIAQHIGQDIANLSDQQVKDTAYATWLDLAPNNKNTLNREGGKYVDFKSQEWNNAIYDAVKQNRTETTEPVRQVAPNEAPAQVPQVNEVKQRQVENTQPTTQETISQPNEKMEMGQRKTYKTVAESINQPQEVRDIAQSLRETNLYQKKKNSEVLSQAKDRIKKVGADNLLNDLTERVNSNARLSTEDTGALIELLDYYGKNGDTQQAETTLQNLAMSGTETAQALQIQRALNHMTPQGQAIWIQRSADKLNKSMLAKKKATIQTIDGEQRIIDRKGNDITDKTPLFKFTPEMQQKLLNSTSENMYDVIDNIYEEMGQQVPKSKMEQFDEWRYFSMLGNPKTHIRNSFGNIVMEGLRQAKNKIAGAIEDAYYSVTGKEGERTHTLRFADKKTKDFAKQDVKNRDVKTMLGETEDKYNPQSRLKQNQRTFKSNLFENTVGKFEKLNTELLSKEDVSVFGIAGLEPAYRRSLVEYITANRLDVDTMTDKQLQKAREYAVTEAKEATFHTYNKIASMINTLENKNLATKILVGGTVPFKQTPMNVAIQGFEYSPAGLLKTLTYDTAQLKKGSINANQYINKISKGLTGTGIALLGYALTSAGILKASGSGDDKDDYEKAQGKQTYSIQIGDNTYTLDWLAPAGIPLFIGSELYQISKADAEEKKGGNVNQNEIAQSAENLFNAMTTTMNPMTEMTMLSGLTDTLKSYANDPAQALGNIFINTGKSYVTQSVPTALGQIARSTDDKERSTSSTESNVFTKAIDSTKNQIMSKVPGLRQMLPVATDVWGNEVEGKNYLENAILPANRKEVKTDKVDEAITKLYDETGESSVIPDTYIQKTLTLDKEKYRLTNEEYAQLKQQYGQSSHDLLEALTQSSDYDKLTNEQKVKAVKEVYSYVKASLKHTYADQNDIDVEDSKVYQKVQDVIRNGGDAKDYFKYVGLTNGMDKDAEKINALENSNIRNKGAIYESTVGKNDATYQIMKNTRVNDKAYLDYKLQDFTGDKDANGKTTYSKQDKFYDYMDNADMTYEQKLLLTGMNYKLLPGERDTLANYIDTLPISASEKTDIYKKLKGATVYQNGEIYY